MKKITPETERKLLSVIEKTASLVNDGETPNDAIVKAAGEAQLRPGEVSLVVHAYNTGRTSRQRSDGSDPFEKSAEFDLADTSQILERLYPSTVKTAAAKIQDTAVALEYGYSPIPMLERREAMLKQASGVDWRTMNGVKIATPAPLPTDPGRRAQVAMANVDRLKIATENARRESARAFDVLGETFNDLTSYFRRPDSLPLPVVKEAVILMHGSNGERLMDQLVRVTPALTKLSNHQLGTSLIGIGGRQSHALTVDDLDCTAAPFDKVATFMLQCDDYLEKKASYEAAVATFDKEAGSAVLPFAYPAVSPSILGPSSDEKRAFEMTDPLKMLGTYSLVSRTMGPIANKLKGDSGDDPYASKQVNKAVNSLNDPAHENKLREINTQAMLQDLMLNDPVISSYDPHEVTGAFNDINQISPSVADQRMLMQSLLRKHLQQGTLDTFDQDQLLGFEDKLRKQTQPMAGKADGSVI